MIFKHAKGTNLFSSPSASQQFEGHGADDLNNELTQALQRVLGGPQCGINFEKLCIIKGQQCWIVYIDAMVQLILQIHAFAMVWSCSVLTNGISYI